MLARLQCYSGEYLIMDMAPTRDPSQYGNEKKLSRHHYLIKMLNRILTAVDKILKMKQLQ